MHWWWLQETKLQSLYLALHRTFRQILRRHTPIYEEVCKYLQHLENTLHFWRYLINCTVTSKRVWENASIPTGEESLATSDCKTQIVFSKYDTLWKVYKGKNYQPKFQRRLSDFRDKANILFDLNKCKCSDMVSNCNARKNRARKGTRVPSKQATTTKYDIRRHCSIWDVTNEEENRARLS